MSPDAAGLFRPNSAYAVQLGGAGQVPLTLFVDVLFLPADFTVTAPALEDNGPLEPGVPFDVRWNPQPSPNLPPNEDVLGVVWLEDSRGSPTHLCPVLHSSGRFTIPGAAIAESKAIAQARGTDPSKLILRTSALTHRLVRLPNGDPENVRRVDMVAGVGRAQLMDVQ